MARHKSTTYDASTILSTILAERKRSAEEIAAPLEWGGWIIRPSDRKYESLSDIPNVCGIYAWHSREGDLLYVGRSKSMRSRLRSHHMPYLGGVLLSYRLVPERYLNGVEMALIEALEPPENASRQAESLPFWDGFCKAAQAAWADVLPAMRERVAERERALAAKIAARH